MQRSGIRLSERSGRIAPAIANDPLKINQLISRLLCSGIPSIFKCGANINRVMNGEHRHAAIPSRKH